MNIDVNIGVLISALKAAPIGVLATVSLCGVAMTGCSVKASEINAADTQVEQTNSAGSHSALIENENLYEVIKRGNGEIKDYLSDPNNSRYTASATRIELPNKSIGDKKIIIENLERKIEKRSSLKDSDDANKSVRDWPNEHSKLAKLYFSEGKSKEGFHQLEFVALYHFDAGRQLSSHYENTEDYPKAYLYYALSRHDSRGGYNEEEFKVLYPVIARLSSKLNDDEILWAKGEIARHLQTRQNWARQVVDEGN